MYIPQQDIFRTADAAAYIGLAKSTLEKRRCYGNSPPFFKQGNAVFYDRTELDEWLESERNLNTPEYCFGSSVQTLN